LEIGLHTPEAHTSIPTASVQVEYAAGVVGSGAPFAIFAMQLPNPPSALLHQSTLAQSVLVRHAAPQLPSVVLQMGPACPGPVQSELAVQLPHAPEDAQNGAFDCVHASVVLLPKSPLHATHWFEAEQRGVSPVHAKELAFVHSTQAPVDEHAGVVPVQSLSDAHPWHVPALGPLCSQTPERQPGSCTPASPAHDAPLGRPHSLSTVLQIPVWHARAPSWGVQVPPGTVCPLAVCAWQTPGIVIWSLHHCPLPQTASLEHVLPQAPVITSQRGPAWVPVVLVQSESVVHTPQVPAAWQ
jgi:hypothetical protein